MKHLAAWTDIIGVSMPPYVNLSRDGADVVITMREPPTERSGAYICGFPTQCGEAGRCTPGDARCNNYCNLAPHKGPMADHPAPCVQRFAGCDAQVRLPLDAFLHIIEQALESLMSGK